MSQNLSAVTVIGIDIGKNSFHVVGQMWTALSCCVRSGREVRSRRGWPIYRRV